MRIKPKIRFLLERTHLTLRFRVFEQDKRFFKKCAYCKETFLYTAYNDIRIASYAFPDITKGTIYLRGHDASRHDESSFMKFNSNEERDCFAEKVINALKDWAANAPEFEEREDSIYEF
jgi:hypothetical protein